MNLKNKILIIAYLASLAWAQADPQREAPETGNPGKESTVIELEAEDVFYSSDMSNRRIEAENASGGAFIGLYPAYDDVGISFFIDIEKAGTYRIETKFNGGRGAEVEFSVNGEAVGEPFTINSWTKKNHGSVQLEAGQIELRFQLLKRGTLWIDSFRLVLEP